MDIDDDRNESMHKSIFPPEIELNAIIISGEDENWLVISFCGECKCDPDHDFSISFENRKTMEFGDYMSFEQVGSDYMLRDNID